MAEKSDLEQGNNALAQSGWAEERKRLTRVLTGSVALVLLSIKIGNKRKESHSTMETNGNKEPSNEKARSA